MKLRLGIQQVGSIVFGRVLEQDESLRCSTGASLASGGNVIRLIRSEADPAIEGCVLFVRGNWKRNDDRWFAHKYDCDADAGAAVTDIKMLVAQINADEQQAASDDCGLEIIE